MTVGMCWKEPQSEGLDTKFPVPAQLLINSVILVGSGLTVPLVPPPCAPTSSDSFSFQVIFTCMMTQTGIWIIKVFKASTPLCGTILESVELQGLACSLGLHFNFIKSLIINGKCSITRSSMRAGIMFDVLMITSPATVAAHGTW